jgi:hypothetical protein
MLGLPSFVPLPLAEHDGEPEYAIEITKRVTG